MTTPAGWYDDGSGKLRWWDGTQWTAHVTVHPPQPEEAFAPPYERPTPAIPSPSAFDLTSAVASPPMTTATLAPARKLSVLGLLGFVIAIVGVVLACIPPIAVAGWIALGLAFVLSLVSLFLRGTKWPGIAGISVTALGAVLAVAVALLTLGIGSMVEADDVPVAPPSERPSTDDDTTATPSEDPSAIEGAEMVPFDDLAVGDCLPLVEYDENEDIYELPVVPCDQPHTDEIFFIYQVEGDEFPGDDPLYDLAWEGCEAQFEAFVGIPYEDSTLDFYSYTPTKTSWIRAEDRTVHCILFSYDDVTSSLAGSGR